MKTTQESIKQAIAKGKTSLGIELGSTRIKAVLIDENFETIASGSYEWENLLEDGFWTYNLLDIITGLQSAYREMKQEVERSYGITIRTVGSIGVSAMMHGYMAFDKTGELLVPFRTWRNATTSAAAKELTEHFQFNIPERWSIAHLYQAIINQEKHLPRIDYMTTLAGYIHWLLTGSKALGIGDASGMFPIDERTQNYSENMMKQFDDLISHKGYPWQLSDILPAVHTSGEQAGTLTAIGASILDQSKNLQPGIPFCPPEGDAGTGMVATNSVRKRTGNVSVGTSVFAMIVLDKKLSNVYPEIDLVTTPNGSPVGMVHANNCSSDLNAWLGLFREFSEAMGQKVESDKLFEVMLNKALEADPDGGGLLSYGYFSGENITGVESGRPLFVRSAKSNFNLANFMRTHLFTAFGALKIGMDLLVKEENVKIHSILAHGGLFKTPVVGQKMMAAAINTPVSVMDTAGEGGAWGMAILSSYMLNKNENESLEDFLDDKVFKEVTAQEIYPDELDVKGFEAFIKRYKKGLVIEKAAAEHHSEEREELVC
ncbi:MULTISPECIES: xylulokinase [Priestia]|uniref:FGGY family of carbohydrate kinases domain protein n=1 Tax=Priestia megaterium (strain ATCC 12872 / QMB1551) TaxID=545693 RepID=D5E0R4_PRIM1|nr:MULTISPECIES: FGGY-family carbohydrate kinase [Priestia]KOP75612.1 ATPase [Bacillus sp. FJAT-21351]KQU12805.1 ATPase [Bacillus sp. Leaf75]ADE70564.1 FGGY family of carbohydrate kinases domain protein [Priestia megaterium QM B1551]KAA8748711.1 FGGY-family carbohydrate kinase [Priestia megaterium]MBG9932387.1 ATPase [Priestia aryabhattai]